VQRRLVNYPASMSRRQRVEGLVKSVLESSSSSDKARRLGIQGRRKYVALCFNDVANEIRGSLARPFEAVMFIR
jgi:hypothetical protein